MRVKIDVLLDYLMAHPADVLLAVEVIAMHDQQIVSDQLTVAGVGPLYPVPGEESLGRRTWMRAEGQFLATYQATVDVARQDPAIVGLTAAPRHQLPALVVPYLWASRYCQSDKFEAFVQREFGAKMGGDKILAMADWIHAHVDYLCGSSDGTTSAVDTFVTRQGVCRDFAHLLIAFARAAGVPARMVSAYALDLQPPDFHAVVEVWLADGWHLVDATKLAPLEGLVRIAVGRDATDISFMTIFGTALLQRQTVSVERIA